MLNQRKILGFFFTAFFAALLLSSGCSSSTTVSTNDGSYTMKSQLAASDVNRMMVKGETPSAVTFDKIVITSTLVFVKDVKLHSDQDDTSKDDHDQNIKTGPFVILFDSTGSHVATTGSIPAGTYDRIKFEVHKPDKNNAADSAILAQYPQFRNGNETFTIVMNGYTETAGVRSYFMVRSHASHNYTVKFKDKDNDLNDRNNLVISGGGASTILFLFDPRFVFHTEGKLIGTLFDPRTLDPDDNRVVTESTIRIVAF